MDTKKLAALAAAVRLGSFTRAAEELGYTQSGLTHMMNSLEKDVGFPLLVRGRTGVRLTPAGQRIFPLVQECLNGVKALERRSCSSTPSRRRASAWRPTTPLRGTGCRR